MCKLPLRGPPTPWREFRLLSKWLVLSEPRCFCQSVKKRSYDCVIGCLITRKQKCLKQIVKKSQSFIKENILISQRKIAHCFNNFVQVFLRAFRYILSHYLLLVTVALADKKNADRVLLIELIYNCVMKQYQSEFYWVKCKYYIQIMICIKFLISPNLLRSVYPDKFHVSPLMRTSNWFHFSEGWILIRYINKPAINLKFRQI